MMSQSNNLYFFTLSQSHFFLIQYTEQEETASEEELQPKERSRKGGQVLPGDTYLVWRLEQRLTQDEGDKGEAPLRRRKFTAQDEKMKLPLGKSRS